MRVLVDYLKKFNVSSLFLLKNDKEIEDESLPVRYTFFVIELKEYEKIKDLKPPEYSETVFQAVSNPSLLMIGKIS